MPAGTERLEQAPVLRSRADGIVLTKLDVTAKGGSPLPSLKNYDSRFATCSARRLTISSLRLNSTSTDSFIKV